LSVESSARRGCPVGNADATAIGVSIVADAIVRRIVDALEAGLARKARDAAANLRF
jgi:hypothetical protein